MARKRPNPHPGTLLVLEHTSRILKGNPLGDPHVRKVGVWLPPQYGINAKERFPVLYDLVGFTGTGLSHTSVDCEFMTLPSREHRGCFGKSSGGYGSIVHAMKYPQYWGAVADHSGDACFDFVYWHDWPNTLNLLAKYRAQPRKEGAYDAGKEAGRKGLAQGLDDGRIRRFLEAVWKKTKVSGAEVHSVMNLCMAATYDPDPKAPNGFRVPFNLESGEVIPARWKRWQANDPVHMVEKHKASLKTLRGIWVDCGWRDQYHIQFGSRQLSARLAQADIRHTYEEFDDDHSDIDYRMDRSLPFLYKALKP